MGVMELPSVGGRGQATDHFHKLLCMSWLKIAFCQKTGWLLPLPSLLLPCMPMEVLYLGMGGLFPIKGGGVEDDKTLVMYTHLQIPFQSCRIEQVWYILQYFLLFYFVLEYLK